MIRVSVDTRIHRVEHSLRDVAGEYFPGDSRDERARLTWRRSIQLRRRNVNYHNLYARRSDRDNETARKKEKEMTTHRRPRKTHDRGGFAAIYDGNQERTTRSFYVVSFLTFSLAPTSFTALCYETCEGDRHLVAFRSRGAIYPLYASQHCDPNANMTLPTIVLI